MSAGWFHKSGEGERGPMSFTELVEAARAGRVARTDLVRTEWHKEWQPADSVLGKYFPGEINASDSSEWSETVKAAVAASKARHPVVDAPRTGPGRKYGNPFRGLGRLFGGLLAPIEWLGRLLAAGLERTVNLVGELGGGLTVWLPIAVAGFFAIAAAGAVGLGIEEWSSSDALLRFVKANPPPKRAGPPPARHPDGSLRIVKADPAAEPQKDEPPPVREIAGRRILAQFGEVSRPMYLCLLSTIVLATGAASFFVGWRLLSERAERGDGAEGGGASARRLLGGRIACACVLFAIVAVWLKDNSMFDTSDARIYGEVQEAVQRTKEMAERETKVEEWEAFEAEVRTSLEPALDKMLQRSKASKSSDTTSQEYYVNYLIRRPLIQVGRNDLPALIRDARRGKLGGARSESADRDLKKVANHLNAMRLFKSDVAQGASGSRD